MVLSVESGLAVPVVAGGCDDEDDAPVSAVGCCVDDDDGLIVCQASLIVLPKNGYGSRCS